MPRSSSHRSPSVSYSRESSVFDPPVYTIYSGSDHVLQFDPPVGSKELAVAMSYHFPGEGSLDAMMRAAVKKHLREERRSRESSKSDSRGRSTNGRLPTPQSEEKHRINRSSAPRLSEQTQPPPLPPRVSVFKSDEPDSTSSGKRGSRRAVSSHVDNSDRKSSHRNDAPHYPADADADERPARPSYGTCLGVPSSSNSRTSKSADSHRRRRADSSGDESDLRILAWNPEVQGFKEKQKKRRYEKEEREQVRANRGHACEDHRKRRVKCDPEKCPNNGQAVKRRESRAGRSQSNRPPSIGMSSSTANESRPASSSTMENSSISFQSPPTLFSGYGNSHIRASSENPNARLTPYPSSEVIPHEFSPEFNHHDTGYGLYPSSVAISSQDAYFAPENLPLGDGFLDPNWTNDQCFLNVPLSEPYNNYSSQMDPISQVGPPQDQFYNPNLNSNFDFLQPYSGSRGIPDSERPRSVRSRPNSNPGLSSSNSTPNRSPSPKRQPRSPAPAHRRRERSPDPKRRPRSPSPRRRPRSYKREESPPASTWQCIKSLATEVSELPNTYKRRSASTYASNQLDVPGMSCSNSSRSSTRRSVSTSKGSSEIDDLSSRFSSWARI